MIAENDPMRTVLTGSLFLLAACGAVSSGPQGAQPIFPDGEEIGTFNRMYTFTENADATIRVWTQEQGDATNLYEMRKKADGTWSAVRQIDEFPNQGMLTEPSFSPADGYLYYASNAVLPQRGRGQDPNIWRVMPTSRGWGAPQPLSDAINTGASELGPVMDAQGRLYFTSNHQRGDGGHDIYEARFDDGAGDWVVTSMPKGFNSPRADAQLGVTPDGNRMFFYTYREPKLGFVDIWTATRGENGKWQQPVNLGPSVNTTGPDLGPSVSLDGKTLYFSRDGRLMSIPLSEALQSEGWTGEPAGDS
jgi:Tol biopolymer transport system component